MSAPSKTHQEEEEEEYEEVEEEVEVDDDEDGAPAEGSEFDGMTEAEYEAELKRRVQEKLAALRKKNVGLVSFISSCFVLLFFIVIPI